jgi:hypothetical protein
MTEPVTTPLRRDSRNTTKSAISSTWPSLPIGRVGRRARARRRRRRGRRAGWRPRPRSRSSRCRGR